MDPETPIIKTPLKIRVLQGIKQYRKRRDNSSF
jgi:hypothetical protein